MMGTKQGKVKITPRAKRNAERSVRVKLFPSMRLAATWSNEMPNTMRAIEMMAQIGTVGTILYWTVNFLVMKVSPSSASPEVSVVSGMLTRVSSETAFSISFVTDMLTLRRQLSN